MNEASGSTNRGTEESTVDGDLYNMTQLRQWLRSLDLPISGNKAALILRLNSISAVDRGECPEEEEVSVATAKNDHNSSGSQSEEEDASESRNMQNFEAELIRRERDLLKRENNLLKRELSLTTNRAMNPIVDLDVHPTTPLNLVKELVPFFDEKCRFELWAKQVRGICSTYNLNDNVMRPIIFSKLKGKALDWVQHNLDCTEYSVDQLLDQLRSVFGINESKLVLRQRFETRKWTTGESFTDYFNAKNMLASTLQLDEDELVDQLIDGIPDKQLKEQAFMQCFGTKMQLLQAFSKISLKSSSRSYANVPKKPSEVDKSQTRCFNCNNIGHWKSECTKPKREPGTCFKCGKDDHIITNCPERNHTISNIEQNQNIYVSLLKFSFNSVDNVNFTANLETLLDTGSPVSIIRRQCLPENFNFDFLPNCKHFYGINKSKLYTYGKIACVVFINGTKVSFYLAVVANNTMSYDVILGRDFLSKTNSKFVFGLNIRSELENKENYDTFRENLGETLDLKNKLDLKSQLDLESKLDLENKVNLENNFDLENETKTSNELILNF